MSWLDIVIILLLIFAVWEGWRQGVITQVLGLAALALGIFLAWRWGGGIGRAFGLEGVVATVAGFSVVLIAVIICVVLIGKLTRGLFRLVGLGIFDRILGMVFSLLKMCLIAGIILMVVTAADPNEKVVTKEIKKSSAMYRTVMNVADFAFPYIDLLTDTIFGKNKE